MSQTNTEQKLLSFIDTKFADPNVALRRLCNLVYNTAKLLCPIRSSVKGQNNGDSKHDDKETKEVRKMKSVFNIAKRAFYCDKTNTNKRIILITTRREYKKIKYTLFNRAKEDRLYNTGLHS